MFAGKVVRNCLIPTVAAVVVEIKGKPKQDTETICSSVCRPSELPIYTPDPKPENINQCKEEDGPPGVIENAFRTTRLTYNKYAEDFKTYKRVGGEHFERSMESLDGGIKYLQKEDNTMPKAGAIGIGALTGLIFGLRGGIIKKTLYATTGALGMAAVCYPKEAAEYSQVALDEAKKYVTIGYNFIYGVKKDDPPLELPSLPKIPTSFSEAWDSVKSTATSFVSEKEDGFEVVNNQMEEEEMLELLLPCNTRDEVSDMYRSRKTHGYQ